MTWPCSPPARPAGPGQRGWITINVESGPETTTIFIRGELDLMTMPVLAEQLALVSRDRPGRLVFELAETIFIDCGSARLIAGAGRWLAAGQRPVIRHPRVGVRRVFDLTGLDADCEIEELAVGSIRTWRFA